MTWRAISGGPYHAELAYQDRYTIRTKITKVTGSLMDIRVAFLDVHEVRWCP
jgi:acyl-CoA thioesterase FadM